MVLDEVDYNYSGIALLRSTSTYLLARGYLLAQRERAVRHQAYADATFVQRRQESADRGRGRVGCLGKSFGGDTTQSVPSTAAVIAGGQLDTRLTATLDPELATIVASFNSMLDTPQQRIERDARLATDVSHELRSPLTTLVGSVDL